MKKFGLSIALAFATLLTALPMALAGIRGYNSSGVDLKLFDAVKCSSGMTCSRLGNKLVMASSAVDGSIVAANAADGSLIIAADNSDDNGDEWSLVAAASGNAFSIMNDTSGSAVSKLSISTAGLLTFADSETMSNASDVIVFSFDDASADVRYLGFEAGDSSLFLQADESDDNGDDWKISNAASGNALSFSNDTSGSQVAKLSISTAGLLTLADGETINNASDVVSFAFDDAAADFRISGFEASNSGLKLIADESDDNGDDWQLQSVAADNTFTISNDASGSQVAKVTIEASDGDLTLTGGITGDGGDTLSGLLQKQVAITTTSITAAQCGSTFVGDSADVIVLPEASTVLGCRLTFVAGTNDDVDIDPADASDEFGPMSVDGAAIDGAAGDEYRMTDIGTSMTIEAVGADLWAVISHNGPITDVN